MATLSTSGWGKVEMGVGVAGSETSTIPNKAIGGRGHLFIISLVNNGNLSPSLVITA